MTTPPSSPTSSLRAAFWRGVRQALPFLLVIIPFGALFGVAGTEAGFNLYEVMGFTIFVIAGASQFTALQLMHDNVPTVLVVVTALAVNLRMAMYSAAIAPHLGEASRGMRALVAYSLIDQTYALAAQQYERAPKTPLREKLAYFFGACLPTCVPWYLATLAGALLGQAIPPELALDFAVPVTFLAMIAPLMRSVPHLAAALVSAASALVFGFLPAGLGVLVAAGLAMWTGGTVEKLLAKESAK